MQVSYPVPPTSTPESSHWEYYMVAILALLLVVAIVGVLVSVNRKRQRGTTWFPEGFIQTLKPKGKNASRNSGVSVRRGPDGEEMKHIHGSQVSCCCCCCWCCFVVVVVVVVLIILE